MARRTGAIPCSIVLGLILALAPIVSRTEPLSPVDNPLQQGPGRAARARADAAVPFKVGEALTYDVSWSGFLVAGTAVSTVKEKRPASGSTAYLIAAEGRPIPLVARLYPLFYRMESLVDTYTLLAHRSTSYSEEAGTRRTATTVFERPANRVSFELRTDEVLTRQYGVPAGTEDGLGAFYLLRARGVKRGERFSIPIADSGTLFTATFTVGDVERVTVPYGTVDAWSIRVALTDAEGQLFWKNTVLWMSNDARRLPVKMQAELPVGSFVLALKSVDMGAR